MSQKRKPAASLSSVDRRAAELDAIASVLPIDRRDELAELLTDHDVETLRHLVNEGMGDNTLRALTSDLAYLQAWSLAATGASLPWPALEALLLKFVAHHLWDPNKRNTDPDHGMPVSVEQNLRDQCFLKSTGPHAPDTLRRRLASWSTLTRWRGLAGAFASPALKSAIRLAVRATPRPRKRKSAKAVTGDILARLLATCGTDSLRDIRDRAILMVAFASGGRRRSAIAGLRKEQLTNEPPITAEDGNTLPSLAVHFDRTRTSGADHDEVFYLIGRPVDGLNAWLEAARIETGSVPRYRPLGQCVQTHDRSAIRQRHRQGARKAGRRSKYLIGTADRGIPSYHSMKGPHLVRARSKSEATRCGQLTTVLSYGF